MSIIEVKKHEGTGLPNELVFDADWYAASYQLDASKGTEFLFNHFTTTGQRMGYQPSPYVMPGFIQTQMARAGLEPSSDIQQSYLRHFDRLDPHILLPRSPFGFIPDRPQKQGIAQEWYNYSIYILRALDTQNIRHNIFFDPGFILDEVGQPAPRPLEHYLRHLSHTNHQTTVLFDPEFYAAAYPDVARRIGKHPGYISLLHHFIQEGMDEGKIPFADFDPEYYRAENPDLMDSTEPGDVSMAQHFLLYGIREGRNPNPYFDTAYYLEVQPDVAEATTRHKLAGPFEHFLKFGYKAGYKANPPMHSVNVPDHLGKALYEKRCAVATTDLLRQNMPIEFPELSGTPKLSCIIPVVNQGHMTIHLLQQLAGIAWRRDMPEMEVIVVDNGSTDITCDLENLTRGARILRSETPLGYPKACNLGAAEARGEFLLIMNNDIEVNADSIRRGIARLQDSPDIGAVGGRIILMNGELQEAGSFIADDGSASGYGRLSDPNLPRYNTARQVDYCSGCFLFLRRNEFQAVGGFDEVFSPGYYEEADLCLRLKEKGLSAFFDPAIYIYHYEYASYSKGRPPTASTALMRQNRLKFLARYRRSLARAPQPGSADWHRRLRQARHGTSYNIAIIEDLIPNPSLGSGFVRTADLIESFLKAGHHVTLFVLHYQPGATAETLQQRGVEIVNCYGPHASPNPLAGREWDFDVVWICRTHNIVTWSNHVRAVRAENSDIKMVFDTEAIASLRDATYREVHNQPPVEDIGQLVADELGQDSAALPDAIITVSAIDREAVEALSIAPIFQLGHKMQIQSDIPPLNARAGLFFCGSFHDVDCPNYDSMEWFLGQVWPRMRKNNPDIRLTIAGYCAPDVPLRALVRGMDGVDYVGRVESLAQIMDQARCFIAPTRFAGGIPHKVHGAMAAGVPVVCTDLLRRQLGNDAFSADMVPVLSADPRDPAAFADACTALLSDDKLWHRQQAAALEFIKATASGDIFEADIERVIDAF